MALYKCQTAPGRSACYFHQRAQTQNKRGRFSWAKTHILNPGSTVTYLIGKQTVKLEGAVVVAFRHLRMTCNKVKGGGGVIKAPDKKVDGDLGPLS